MHFLLFMASKYPFGQKQSGGLILLVEHVIQMDGVAGLHVSHFPSQI